MKKTWRRPGRLLLAAALLLSMAAPAGAPLSTTAQAVTQSDIDALKDDADSLAEERQEVRSQLAQLRDDRSRALERRALLDQEIALTEREITNTESQIAGYEALLAQTALELEENLAEEAHRQALFRKRARAMEENGTASYWSVLFNATDFADLLSRLADIQEIMDYDQRVLDDLRDIQGEIQERQSYQEELKTGAEAAKATLEAQKADLDSQRAEAHALVQELESGVGEYEALLQEIEAEEERIQQEIVEKTEELARQMGWDATAGGYIWPVTASRRITSPMGSRNTGIPGASTNHKGVDIGGVGYNSNVLATKAGVVSVSTYSSSYGNYVVISHGRGNTTLYAHMSSRSVAEGDVVTQGQVIGITGSTGISNGPHLHYEITEGGQRVDPLQYLPGYIQAW